MISVLVVGACTNIIQQAKKYIAMLVLLGILAHLIFIAPILFSYPMIITITVHVVFQAPSRIFYYTIFNSQDKGLIIALNNLFIVLGANGLTSNFLTCNLI